MTASTVTDINGVEYFFASLTRGGNDSGWQDSPTYTDSGLDESTETVIDANDDSQAIILSESLTINPAASLLPGKTYAVQIAAAALQDNSGNPFPGISDDTTWNFSSEVVPYVWTQTAGSAQAWTTGGNWQCGAVPSPIVADTVDFSTVNIAANTILILGADRGAQLWKFGDTSGAQTWTISPGSMIILAGATPTIQVDNSTAILENVVDGSAGLIKSGGGTLDQPIRIAIQLSRVPHPGSPPCFNLRGCRQPPRQEVRNFFIFYVSLPAHNPIHL